MTKEEHRAVIEELAGVFDNEEAARDLLDRISFPSERRPGWETALYFWSRVYGELRKGLKPDGVEAILRCAFELYPGSATFRRLGGGTTSSDEVHNLPLSPCPRPSLGRGRRGGQAQKVSEHA